MNRKRKISSPIAVETVDADGNLFEVLGRPNANELLAKAELARAIEQLIRTRGLTQAAAARILGVTQPDISDLYRGRLGRFSLERLYRFLNTLGQDVRIEVRPKARSRPYATVKTVIRLAVH